MRETKIEYLKNKINLFFKKLRSLPSKLSRIWGNIFIILESYLRRSIPPSLRYLADLVKGELTSQHTW